MYTNVKAAILKKTEDLNIVLLILGLKNMGFFFPINTLLIII